MERNTENIGLAYIRMSPFGSEPVDQFNNPIIQPEPPKEAVATRRSVDLTDIQLYNTIVNSLAATAIVECTEDTTVYKSVLDDASRIKGNEVVREIMDRISNEIKLRG